MSYVKSLMLGSAVALAMSLSAGEARATGWYDDPDCKKLVQIIHAKIERLKDLRDSYEVYEAGYRHHDLRRKSLLVALLLIKLSPSHVTCADLIAYHQGSTSPT